MPALCKSRKLTTGGFLLRPATRQSGRFSGGLLLRRSQISDQLKITTGSLVATVGGSNNTNHFQLDAAAYPGNSGGPVLNSSGNLIGILSAGIPGKEGFSFAIKSATLSRFLESHEAKFQTADIGPSMTAADIYEQAKRYTVLIRCLI
ncbi:MAG: serine protease [Rhodospirillaceae bacterium]|nr:serine protease [Rhodospirillaceae bacterium]MBT6610451.1 serine protease [Rhodospirillaceae bacterium]